MPPTWTSSLPPTLKPGIYVAAMYIPGTQMLVISGKFGDAFLGQYRMSKKEYRELYMDLQGASIAGSGLFAQDAGADGFALKPTGDGAPDSYEEQQDDGIRRRVEESEDRELDYMKSFTEADEQYARALALLIAQVKLKTDS